MWSAVKVTTFGLALACAFLCATASSGALKPLKVGQYKVGINPTIQEICLKSDGTWYGTSFNFGGHWINYPANISRVVAATYGGYQVQGHEYDGYGNTVITISDPAHSPDLVADWYDWFDDFSYQMYLTGLGFVFEKKNCDPPFKGDNTHAATDSGG